MADEQTPKPADKQPQSGANNNAPPSASPSTKRVGLGGRPKPEKPEVERKNP